MHQVRLNAGGRVFSTSVETLCSVPSLLAVDASNGFVGRAAVDGLPFYDIDPHAFGAILDYLRGYPVSCEDHEVAWVAQQASTLGLSSLAAALQGVAPALTTSTASRWRFLPGPGTTTDGQTVDSCRLFNILRHGKVPHLGVGLNRFALRLDKLDTEARVVCGVAHIEDPSLAIDAAVCDPVAMPLSIWVTSFGQTWVNTSTRSGAMVNAGAIQRSKVGDAVLVDVDVSSDSRRATVTISLGAQIANSCTLVSTTPLILHGAVWLSGGSGVSVVDPTITFASSAARQPALSREHTT